MATGVAGNSRSAPTNNRTSLHNEKGRLTVPRPHLSDYYASLTHSPLNQPPEIVNALLGVVQPRGPRRRKVAIVGAGHGKQHAPTGDDTWEVWALNAVPVLDRQGRLRADRWFELHERHAQSAQDMAFIRQCPVPLYLPPAWAERMLADRYDELNPAEDVPNGLAYPLDAIEAHWGSYFTCTFAYQMALAAHEQFETVGLFGVELAYGTARERSFEWACVSFWMGALRGMGINIMLPPGTLLGRHPHRYGIEYTAEKEWVEQFIARVTNDEAVHKAAEEGVGG